MRLAIGNYDGSVVARPQQLVRPESVEELQSILSQPDRFPGPVRPMGSFHSLTPCAASPGTVVDMSGFKRILAIDGQRMTFTAQAGLQIVDAGAVLRRHQLQFVLNIEIGNLTLGSAACCHTKDALDGVEFGQVNSYVTGAKWVSPSGKLEEASEELNPELLSLVRSSYGLCGIIYEVTFKVKPLEVVRFNYHVFDLDALTMDRVSELIRSNDAMVCWTSGRTVVIQTRNRATELRRAWFAGIRRLTWSYGAAFSARAIRQYTPGAPLTNLFEDVAATALRGCLRFLSAIDGFSLYDPDKTINYRRTPPSARYAFTFWAFPRDNWVTNLNEYVTFRDDHFKKHGFRCNLPLGSYFIRRDTSSLLSYSFDGDIISLDPIHAYSEVDKAGWERFLHEFNEWSYRRGGIPLLNQSPFVTREHVVSAYGERWRKLSDWIRSVDPAGRMLNPFFQDLLV